MRLIAAVAAVAAVFAGCARDECEGTTQVRKPDGNCYALDDGGPAAAPWLVDDGLAAGLQDRQNRNRGLAAADFDGDGDIDLYLSNPGDPAVLLRNDGTGTFSEWSEAPSTGNDTAVGAADFDNDGDPDLWVGCGGWGTACLDAVFRNDGLDPATGELRFTELSTEADLGTAGRQAFGVAWGDYDNDGLLDVFVSNKKDWSHGTASAADQLFRNLGDGRFEEVGEEAGVAGGGDSHNAAWLDVEPDGDLDLFVPVLFGDNQLFLNQGDGTFTPAVDSPLARPYAAFGSAAMDYDNDGRVDLFVTATSGSGWAPEDHGEEAVLFHNDGGGAFTAIPLSELLGAAGARRMTTMGLTVGDLDLDGVPDFFLGNGEPVSGALNALIVSTDTPGRWSDDSTLIDQAAPQDSGPAPYRSYPYRSHGAAILDVDGDHDNDLVVGNGGMNLIPDTEEPNRLFRSTLAGSESPPATLLVRLLGTQSNRDGVGALVTIEGSSGSAVTRFITRATGFTCSGPAWQLIGLGDRPGPYTVRVDWPSGVVDARVVGEGMQSIELVEGEAR